MKVHRLGTARHPIWDGTGAATVGGRWNDIGIPVIYGASSMSLAMLERLVQRSSLRRTLKVTATIPDGIMVESVSEQALPGWREPDSASARRFGSLWARERRSAVLLVPSAIVPDEANVLINPAHPDAALIVPSPAVALIWDRRLFGIPEPTAD